MLYTALKEQAKLFQLEIKKKKCQQHSRGGHEKMQKSIKKTICSNI